jgi:hypothetical protein
MNSKAGDAPASNFRDVEGLHEVEAIKQATGVWALQDVVRLAPGLNLQGYGHYHETYEKVDGRWYIKSSKLTRLREDIFNPVFTFRVPKRLRDAAGAVVRKRTK